MRLDLLWLADMITAAETIASFIQDMPEESFLADPKTQSAVLQQLTIIGEAAAHLSRALRQRHPEVDWVSIIGFRNRAVHAYFTIDWSIVWDTATRNLPELIVQIAVIQSTESASSPGQWLASRFAHLSGACS